MKRDCRNRRKRGLLERDRRIDEGAEVCGDAHELRVIGESSAGACNPIARGETGDGGADADDVACAAVADGAFLAELPLDRRACLANALLARAPNDVANQIGTLSDARGK
jgi:hypothetical protein